MHRIGPVPEFADLELVICDNASDDDTVETARELRAADRPRQPDANPADIGSHENMNACSGASGSALFRWISADDWLEPSACHLCTALEHHSEAVGVTTWFTVHTRRWRPGLSSTGASSPTPPIRLGASSGCSGSSMPATRSTTRSTASTAARIASHRLRPSERADWLLCAELALMGPIVNVAELLAHRTRTYPTGVDRAAFRTPGPPPGWISRGQNQRPALRSPEQTAPSRIRQSFGILSMRPVFSSMMRSTVSLTGQRLAAVGQHLAVERQAAVDAGLVERGRDLVRPAHADEVAGLKVQAGPPVSAPRALQRQRLELAEPVSDLHHEAASREERMKRSSRSCRCGTRASTARGSRS